jgi:hypothetical protein
VNKSLNDIIKKLVLNELKSLKSNFSFLKEQEENDEESKNILDTLQDAINSTKKDIEDANKKKDELNKILSVKKNPIDRNYISAKIKEKADEIQKKKDLQKNQEANLKKQQDIMSKSKAAAKEKEVNLEEKFVPKKTLKVIFDKSTGKPWEVSFTDRGFQIGETRLSFENIENAIDKNFNIVLDAGNGLVLDQNKLNKILKYKGKV